MEFLAKRLRKVAKELGYDERVVGERFQIREEDVWTKSVVKQLSEKKNERRRTIKCMYGWKTVGNLLGMDVF